ncbi:MAG: hypothetical protein RL756_695 [Pseudomonadota bacterium]|jgi:AcrR family transcriptional regulator
MNLLTTAYLLERYGPRLGMDQIAEVLGMSTGTLHNRVYRGQIELATYMDGGKRYADVRDLAAYLDQMRGRATARAADSCIS